MSGGHPRHQQSWQKIHKTLYLPLNAKLGHYRIASMRQVTCFANSANIMSTGSVKIRAKATWGLKRIWKTRKTLCRIHSLGKISVKDYKTKQNSNKLKKVRSKTEFWKVKINRFHSAEAKWIHNLWLQIFFWQIKMYVARYKILLGSSE